MTQRYTNPARLYPLSTHKFIVQIETIQLVFHEVLFFNIFGTIQYESGYFTNIDTKMWSSLLDDLLNFRWFSRTFIIDQGGIIRTKPFHASYRTRHPSQEVIGAAAALKK